MKIEFNNPSALSMWEEFAGDYACEIRKNRDGAIVLLTHSDEVVRCAAVESFLYFWEIDEYIINELRLLAISDKSALFKTHVVTVLTVLWYHDDNGRFRDIAYESLRMILNNCDQNSREYAVIVKEINQIVTFAREYL